MKKIIDQNGRLFGRISILDLLVVALVAVLALTLVVKQEITAPTNDAANGTPVTYTIFCHNILNELAADITVGDDVFDHNQTKPASLGKITKVEIVPAERTVGLPDGTLGRVLAPDCSDVTITVEGTCTMVNGQYRFHGNHVLGINANRNFYSRFVAFTGMVTSIG